MALTPRAALDALHRSGRLGSPLLYGMRVHVAGRAYRFVGYDPEGRPIAHHDRATSTLLFTLPQPWLFNRDDKHPENDDLRDPCTVGGLLALLREATGDPWLFVQRVDCDGAPERWTVWHCPERDARPVRLADGPTEGCAIAAALVALAGGAA